MNNTSLFRGGIPTAPDVERLIVRFGIPKVGDVINYSDIADAIGRPPTNRYHSVVNAWRKRLDIQHNLLLTPVRGQGYQVCNNSQRVAHSTTCFKSGLKRVRRASDVAARTDTAGLRPEESRARDHIVKTGNALQLAAATAARQLRYPSDDSKNIT